MPKRPRVLILRAAGTNCDVETAHAFELAGASAEAVHVNRLIGSPGTLDGFDLMAIPGGFSYGDDIAAGRILAQRLTQRLAEPMRRFVEAGRPILGICNGFQVLLRAGLLGIEGGALTNNTTPRFVDEWVTLRRGPAASVWTRLLPDEHEVPIAHGEGRFVASPEVLRQVEADHLALSYAENPNGSALDVAGLCDRTGLVLGLMPHPERHVDPTQHPAWTSRGDLPAEGPGLLMFRGAVEHAHG